MNSVDRGSAPTKGSKRKPTQFLLGWPTIMKLAERPGSAPDEMFEKARI